MSSKARKKEFDQAADAFKTAEANAARLKSRADEISALLLQGRLAHSQLGTEIDRLSTGDGSLGADLATNLALIKELAAKRSANETETDALERAHEAAGRAYAEAKVQIVIAEDAARRAQAAYFSTLARELVDEFMRTNHGALQRLLQVAHADGMHDMLSRPGYEQNAGNLSISRLDNLFETVLAEAATRMTPSDDESFHSVVGTTQRGDPPYAPLTSSLISSQERARIREARGTGTSTTHAVLLDALSHDDSPKPGAPMTNEERASARGHLQYHRALAADARALLAQPNAGLTSLLAAEDGALRRRREELREKAERAEAIVARWEEMLDQDEALRC
ncbi:MAG: hypothetical protein AMXMBFR59_06860 [Rhodanobacteraceae bacterium]